MYEEILKKIKEIPPLSGAAMELLRCTGDENAGPREYAKIVERDPALTMNILRVVNAPAFGLGQPIKSINMAVSLLGARLVVGIALGSSCPAVFNTALPGYEADRGELWRHGLFTAIAAREIAAYATVTLSPDEAFTGGLLHDIGKSVISDFLKNKTEAVLASMAEQTGINFTDAERAAAGGDHTEVGAALARNWKLPPALVQVIKFHHTPAKAEERFRPLVYAAHLADITAMMEGAATGADTLMYHLDPNYTAYFNLTEADLQNVILNTIDEFDKLQTPLFD